MEDRTPDGTIGSAINIIGFDGMKAGSSGHLAIDDRGIAMHAGNASGFIPAGSIRSFAVEPSSKALLRGVAGTLASLAPNGAGQLYSAVRRGAETLTVFYVDEHQAWHCAVLLVPQSRKDPVLAAFSRLGIEPVEAVTASGAARQMRGAPRHLANGHSAGGLGRQTVRIAIPHDNGLLPAALTAASYESLIAQSRKSGLFTQVWRQGDQRAAPDAMNLSLDVEQYKKGSAALRGAVPVVGMIVGKTLIRANLRLEDAEGNPLFDQEVKGSKRMMGESFAASTSLAQRSIQALASTSSLTKGVPLPPEAAARDPQTASRF